ncbi:hypothetical protein M5K25_016021 [Dendrobium thyrsiflorum]|uniref:Uncharacterized protein n=1 Tax=Dendrobium thyrsiflorum TaxID=117978 RepID=A0ABD0UZ26_DENTH
MESQNNQQVEGKQESHLTMSWIPEDKLLTTKWVPPQTYSSNPLQIKLLKIQRQLYLCAERFEAKKFQLQSKFEQEMEIIRRKYDINLIELLKIQRQLYLCAERFEAKKFQLQSEFEEEKEIIRRKYDMAYERLLSACTHVADPVALLKIREKHGPQRRRRTGVAHGGFVGVGSGESAAGPSGGGGRLEVESIVLVRPSRWLGHGVGVDSGGRSWIRPVAVQTSVASRRRAEEVATDAGRRLNFRGLGWSRLGHDGRLAGACAGRRQSG